MNKLNTFSSQLLILGVVICMTTAISVRHKRNLIAEFNIPEPEVAPGPDPGIDQFPHETTCHYYYLVVSEDDISVNRCPDGELFDYIDHKCASKEDARCWSRHFGKMKHHHIKLKSRGHFRCPYAWGKYPDVKNCTSYYVCLNGKVKHKHCAPFEHFDKVSRKCIAKIEGVCADETDIGDPHYKCPRSWGSFSFPDNCSKYYECLEKRPSLRTCPNDTLFHERKETCLPHKHVHCGSRHNPYRKKGKSTNSINPKNSKVTSSKTTVSDKEKKPESKHETISESKMSTPDPNSIIIERRPIIADYSPSIENLSSTVNKVTYPESNLVTSSKAIITSNEIEPKSENKVTPESKISTPDPNSIIIQTMSTILDNAQSETNQTTEKQDLPVKQSSNKGSTILPVHSMTNKGSTVLSVQPITNEGSTILPIQPTTNKGSTGLPVQPITNEKSTILPIQPMTNKESTVLPVQKMTDEESTNVSMKQSVSNKETNDLTTKSTIDSKKSTILPVTTSNENDSSVKISTETVLFNDTDEVTDKDPEIIDEFIEISTSEAKSPLATQTVVVDSTQNPKKETEESNDVQSTAKPPQVTPMEECDPKDPTCITSERGQVIRCPGEEGLFPYPEDERRFLICQKFNIHVKFCPGVTIFNALERKCFARLIFG
ncbi:hypothetical protein JTE90_006564 [Oedothorax gibbosus]|uniref:Chitin-binding type-2 domain-containing protein n=1 Tax=Oedothorax gibbosus TaxID=931172 RepID=A0AAV6VJ79_9ARAC|nr:hypothetical protein JTE90_006564 [Oedothorax gibbosus]